MRSMILVSVQFGSVAAIAVTGPFPADGIPLLLLLAGSLLGAAAIITMRWDNLRIFPEPKKDIRLVTSGPYRFIRHPMYTALLMLMAAWPIASLSILHILLWSLLALVLVLKIRIEEQMLPLVIPEYRHYQERTWKLIPFLY
ncbi:MAG: isoprenylcysteine carboxylmethyltransferase family protein [Bacteroidetes bacterium]|nr:isoprenylcysteine carboxylmethyltransferase family protein [Bacteroidota bacterium]